MREEIGAIKILRDEIEESKKMKLIQEINKKIPIQKIEQQLAEKF